MKRDSRLHGLTADHHRALSLASRLLREAADASVVARVRAAFDADLAPHFAMEEQLLLGPLREAGEAALVDRTLREHGALRAHLAAAEAGEFARIAAFAELLTAHVRFEERELFPACEAKLAPSVLDAVARRVSGAHS